MPSPTSETSSTCDYDYPAIEAFQKAASLHERTLRSKMLDGYFVSTPRVDAAPGQVVFDGRFKESAEVFDLELPLR